MNHSGEIMSQTRDTVLPRKTARAASDSRFADPTELVRAAIDGDRRAWDALVVRYSPLVVQITRRYRLRPSDSDDVFQVVWLRLLQQLGKLREPRALPGWIASTAR